LGFSCPCHRIKILGRFSFVLIGGDKGEQLKFAIVLAHLKLAWELLLIVMTSCIPFFEQLAKNGLYQFQDMISKRLHDHFFSSILSNLPLNVHHARLRSCLGPRVGT
jgi:hypothetical protein